MFYSSVRSSSDKGSHGLALIYRLNVSSLAFLVKHTAEFSYVLLITGDII